MKKLSLFFGSIVTFGTSLAVVAYAQGAASTNAPITSKTTLKAFLCSIVGWFFWIIIVISVIMILFAAFTYVTARDDQEKTSKARKTLTYAAIGIAVALMAYGFPLLVANVFPGNSAAIPTDANCLSSSTG